MATDRRRVAAEAAAADTSRWKEGNSAGADDDRDRRGEKEADEGGDQPLRLLDDGLGAGKRGGAGRADRSGVGGGNRGVGIGRVKAQWKRRKAKGWTDEQIKITKQLTNQLTHCGLHSETAEQRTTIQSMGGKGEEEKKGGGNGRGGSGTISSRPAQRTQQGQRTDKQKTNRQAEDKRPTSRRLSVSQSTSRTRTE